MKGKKSFILYSDMITLIEKLPDETAGKLFKIIFQYVNDMNPKVTDLLLQVAFEPIKLQLKRDLINWHEETSKRSEAGKLGGIKSGEIRKKKAQIEAKRRSASKIEANEGDSVNVTVNDNVNDISERQKKLNDLLNKNFPELMEFKKPLTIEQYDKLKGNFDLDLIEDKMLGLANRKGASKDYISVYSTLSGWLKKDFEKIKL